MIKILFVCHGNICRSPMAEFIMKKMVMERGMAERFEIASAATSTEEIGNPVYPAARKRLAREGIRTDGKTARQIRKSDYDYYDYLIGMEHFNLRNMERIMGQDKCRKYYLLRDFTDTPGDIDDPWYSGDFEMAYNQILQGCQGLLAFLTKESV